MIARVAVLGSMFVALGSAEAFALEATVAPADVDLVLEPGSSTEKPIHVYNRGNGPLVVSPEIWDWWYDPSNSHEFLPPGTHERSASAWLSVVPAEQHVPVGEEALFRLVASPPADLPQGGYYAVVFFSVSGAVDGAAENQVRVGGRLGVLTMTRTSEADEVIVHGEPVVQLPTTTRPLAVTLELTNAGNVHLSPTWTAVLRNKTTKAVVGRIEGSSVRLLPGQTKPLVAEWSGLLTASEYDLLGALTYGNGKSVPVTTSFVVGAP